MKNRMSHNHDGGSENEKSEQLEEFRVQNTGKPLTTNQSKKLSNDSEQLKAGVRGPSLRQNFEFFDKMSHFVREPIPERKVHAREYGAHGEFECYQSMKQYTKACFLQEAGKKTPVFVRFSTVQGSRGSKDTARDLRCKGVKFYTEEGNYDVNEYISVAYKHYKPIGVSTAGQKFIQKTPNNNLAGVVFAANNPDFGEEFVAAIAQQRFYERT